MEILKDAGEYTLITPPDELRAQLLRIEQAGRTCYQSERGDITAASAQKFVRMLVKRGHFSVLEHSLLTVNFDLLSRGFTHEQVRHRLTAISQESTRYVDYAPKPGGEEGEADVDLDNFSLQCVVPPHRDEKEVFDIETPQNHPIQHMAMTPEQMFETIESFYRALRKGGWKPEDARQLLPIGTKSEIVISANLREWRHIFFMRTAKYAHWEIRRVMCNLLEELKGIIPVVFEDFVVAGQTKNGVRYYEQG